MNYTQSDAFIADPTTGKRRHQDSLPIPTAWSADDANMLIWSLMAVIEGSGMTGVAFDPSVPSTYTRLRDALDRRFMALTDCPLNPKQFPFLAKFDGATVDTGALNACFDAARLSGQAVYFPALGTALVNGSLDVTRVTIYAPIGTHYHVQATSAQFDVLKTSGNTWLMGLRVHGGWDGSTSGQAGNGLAIAAVAPAYPYNVHLRDVVIQYAKRCGVSFTRGGYSTAFNVKVNACGRDGLELAGISGTDATTTVFIDGSCVFSDTPFGYGARLTNCINLALRNTIMEYTKGIQLNGTDNRSIMIHGVYQEATSGGLFLTDNGSSGIGLEVKGCFGGGASIPYLANWQGVEFGANSALSEPAISLAGRLLRVDGGELTATAAGSYTAASLVLPPGSYMVMAVLQTRNAALGALDRAAILITTDGAADGLANSTSGSDFAVGADEQRYNPGAVADLRCKAWRVVENTGTGPMTVYLRTNLGVTAGTVAYRGAIEAMRIK